MTRRPTLGDRPPSRRDRRPSRAPSRRPAVADAGARGVGDDLRFFARTTATALRSLRRNALRSALTTLGIIIGVGVAARDRRDRQGGVVGDPRALDQDGGRQHRGPGGRGVAQRRQPGQRQHQDADARGRRGDPPRMPERRQPGAPGLHPPAGRPRQQELGPEHLRRHHAGIPPRPRVGRPGRGRAVHRPATSTTSRWSACSARRSRASSSASESPVGQEVYVNDVPLRVLGVLSRKGADIIGEDQDDLLLAPWTTVKFRVSAAASAGDTRSRVGPDPTDPLEPAGAALPRRTRRAFPDRLADPDRSTRPGCDRLSNVDSILVRASSTDEIPAAMDQITRVLRERHRIAPGRARRLRRPRLHRGRPGRQGDRRPGGRACCSAWP